MLCFVVLLAAALAVPRAAAVYVGSGTHPWAVVLCNFSDEPATPHPPSYYEQLFSDAGAGELGLLDFWHDVSFGQLSMSGTYVTPGWSVARDPSTGAPLTRVAWNGLSRLGGIQACADGATGIDWSKYWGVLAIFPEVRATLAAPVDAAQTSFTVDSAAGFPSGTPYTLGVGQEDVTVTAVDGNTLTVVRGAGGTTAASHGSGR